MDTYRESGCSSALRIYDFTNSAFYYVLPAQ